MNVADKKAVCRWWYWSCRQLMSSVHFVRSNDANTTVVFCWDRLIGKFFDYPLEASLNCYQIKPVVNTWFRLWLRCDEHRQWTNCRFRRVWTHDLEVQEMWLEIFVSKSREKISMRRLDVAIRHRSSLTFLIKYQFLYIRHASCTS